MIRILALCVAVLAGGAGAGSLPDDQQALFLDFARVVSDDDPVVMARAKAFVATPPTTTEEIGYYGMKDAPAPERALRGIIHQLIKAGHLVTVEDKYAYELPFLLFEQDYAERPEDLAQLDVLKQFADADPDVVPDDAFWQAFRVWFPSHTRAIEAAVTAHGGHLLSLNLPLGDTLHYWVASPEEAEHWRGRALYIGVNTQRYSRGALVRITVTAPNWGEYWDLMTYALQMPEPYWPRPDGL